MILEGGGGGVKKFPFTYWLNGRWFLQIVDGDSWNLYPLWIFFKKTILSHFTFYAIFNITKILKSAPSLLVKWEVVSPLFPSYDFVSQIWGGGAVMFFSHFMLFPTFLEKKIWEYKIIISHLMFSSCFFYAGNIVKYPFTYSYWLNGRWFLQIVDIGNFIMRLEILKSAPSLTG